MRFSRLRVKPARKHKLLRWALLIASILVLLLTAAFIYFRALGWGTWPWNLTNYDPTNLPKIVNHHYIDMDRIHAVSKFRSGAGHDASDSYERCRSMKHYFAGSESDPNPTSISLYAPFDGTVVFFSPDGEDVQIWLRPDGHPNILAMIFHTVPEVRVGQRVISGQKIGHHSGKSWSDMLIAVHGLFKTRHVSYFEVMNDDVFEYFRALGFKRSDFIIAKAERDANPLKCTFGIGSLTRTGLFNPDEPRDRAYVDIRKDPSGITPSETSAPEQSDTNPAPSAPPVLY